MKYHTEDEREFRTLGRAMEHAEHITTGPRPLYWKRDYDEELETYAGCSIDPDEKEMEIVTMIVRK